MYFYFQLTDIPLTSYVAASTLGMLPTAVLNCYMGTTLRSMNDILTDETNQTTGWIVLIVQVSRKIRASIDACLLLLSSSRSPTRPVQQQWWSWWSSSGPPSPHIISGEAELMMATVRFALVGVCYISEEHARLSGPNHHRDTLGKERFLVINQGWR